MVELNIDLSRGPPRAYPVASRESPCQTSARSRRKKAASLAHRRLALSRGGKSAPPPSPHARRHSRANHTLRLNRPHWNVIQQDIREFKPSAFGDVDLIACGVPSPPFSIAAKQHGGDDERDMFPTALNIIAKIKPRAVMLENVQGLASPKFKDYRCN